MRYPGCLSIDSKPPSVVILTMILDTHESMAKSLCCHTYYVGTARMGKAKDQEPIGAPTQLPLRQDRHAQVPRHPG